ncbi:acyl-CoA dehydrogenase family protein [Alcaligenaceae bacterium]|nr:acyl-CoA dehydrogenase family protein [Alcaligenaceae bacterium]
MNLSDSLREAGLRSDVEHWLRSNLNDSRRESIESAIVRGDSGPSRRWQRDLFEAGYAVRSWPKRYGGQEGSLSEDLILFETLARHDAPDDIFRVGTRNIGPVLLQMGTGEQKDRLLAPTAEGTILWSQGFSEPGAGTDLASLRSKAIRTDDGFVLQGQKVWNTFGHMADWCLLLMRSGDTDSRHRGLSAFAVPMTTPGIEVRPIAQISGRSDFNEVFLSDVEVPNSALIGEEGDGWKVAVKMLDFERRGLAAIGFDCMKVFRNLRRHVAEMRHTDGTELINLPHVRRRIAELSIQVRIAMLNNHRFAAMVPEGEAPGPEASVQKLHATELFKALHGTLAELTLEAETTNNVAMLMPKIFEGYFGSFGFTIGGGTAQVQRNIIAERVLNLPK